VLASGPDHEHNQNEHRTTVLNLWLLAPGKSAILEVETESRDASSGQPLALNVATCVLRGAGGFGSRLKPSDGEGPRWQPCEGSLLRLEHVSRGFHVKRSLPCGPLEHCQDCLCKQNLRHEGVRGRLRPSASVPDRGVCVLLLCPPTHRFFISVALEEPSLAPCQQAACKAPRGHCDAAHPPTQALLYRLSGITTHFMPTPASQLQQGALLIASIDRRPSRDRRG